MDFEVFLPIEKVDKEKRIVWGYASTPTKDLQGEIVPLDAIKAALPEYMQWRNVREMHTSSAVGSTVEAHVDEKGLYIGAKIRDDAAWQKCIESSPGANDQVYRGFSIGGSKLQKTGDTINELRLSEISLVDRPANPDCRIDVAKAAGESNQSSNEKLFEKLLDMGRAILGLEKSATLTRHPHFESPDEDKLSDAELAALTQKMSEVEFEKRAFSEKERKHLASTGQALPDGSFPIASEMDVRNAVQAHGRAADPAKAKAHITERAKSLKLTNLLPADWPGSTKEEKTIMDTDLQKRFAAASKSAIDKAKQHLGKAMDCHSKACESLNALHKCMGKADGADEKDKHVRAMASHMERMSDHHDLAMHNLSTVAAAWKGEGGESPKATENGDIPESTASLIALLPQSHLTEGAVRGSDYRGAGDSPYSAAAISDMVKAAVTEATKPLTDKVETLTTENAFMKGQMTVLERQPSNGRRPVMFGSGGNADALFSASPEDAANKVITKAYQSITPEDPEAATQAISAIIGTRAANPKLFGKSFSDPEYAGSVGR